MKKRGFTLIELMVVIAIIGLLAAIALPRFANVSDSAKAANVQGNISSLRTSIAMFHAKSDEYPNLTISGGNSDLTKVVSGGGNGHTVKFTDFFGKNAMPETPAYKKGTTQVAATNTVQAGTGNGNSITATNKGGWAYRATDGAIRASLDSNAYGQSVTWSDF